MISKDNIQIREVQLTDAANLIEYLKKVMSETDYMRMYPDEVRFSIKEEEDYIQMMLDQENSKLLVALDDTLIVSVAGLQGQQFRKFKHCTEFGISVLKDYWGLGIGKEMTIRLVEWCKQNPIIKKIILHVNAENKVAIHLYESLDFKVEGILSNDFYYDDRFVDTFIYRMNV